MFFFHFSGRIEGKEFFFPLLACFFVSSLRSDAVFMPTQALDSMGTDVEVGPRTRVVLKEVREVGTRDQVQLQLPTPKEIPSTVKLSPCSSR